MKSIIYIGNFDFVVFNAQSQLVLSNGKILRDLGYNVLFIGSTTKELSKIPQGNIMFIDGFKVYHIQFNKKLNELLNWKENDKKIKDIIKSSTSNVKFIIFYGSPTYAIQVASLINYAKRNRIKTISNLVDISTTSHGKIYERIFKYADIKIKEFLLANFTDGIIAVSKYIENYYNVRKRKHTIIIPPLKDCNTIKKFEYIDRNFIRFTYAGIPFPVDGRRVDKSSYKDRLDLIIEVFSKVHKLKSNFKLDIYGITASQYLRVIPQHLNILNSLTGNIEFHGLVDAKFISNEISNSDFTINLRDSNRMTNAGFSSKFVESISNGTPVVTTKTSDVTQYLKLGLNGFIVDLSNLNNVINDVKALLEINRSEIYHMKEYCLNSKIFDYKNYLSQMEDFLKEL